MRKETKLALRELEEYKKALPMRYYDAVVLDDADELISDVTMILEDKV